MAGTGTQFDLKNARLYIRDGYSMAGAVNNASGYTTGAATMTVDGITGAIPVGARFTIDGSATIYTVATTTETGGNTTSITFAPTLTADVTDNDVLEFRPNQIEVRLGSGNLTYEIKKERQYIKDRGRLGTVRDGDEMQLDVTFDFVFDHIRSSTGEAITIQEALDADGAAAGWVSADPDRCQPYAVDLVLVNEPICDEEDPETLVFPMFRYDSLQVDARAGTVAGKGSCNVVKPTATRSVA